MVISGKHVSKSLEIRSAHFKSNTHGDVLLNNTSFFDETFLSGSTYSIDEKFGFFNKMS